MVKSTSTVIQRSYLSLVQQRAALQLNTAEREEMECFVIWSTAVGVYVNTKGKQRYESEPAVRYVKKPGLFDRLQLPPEDSETPINDRASVQTRDQIFCTQEDNLTL